MVQQQITQQQEMSQNVAHVQNTQQLSSQQPSPKTNEQHSDINITNANQTQHQPSPSSSMQTKNEDFNAEQSTYSQHNLDGFRRNNRNSRWGNNNNSNNVGNSNNNNNNRNNRMCGGNNFNNRNNYDRENQHALPQDASEPLDDNSEKSQEEIAFDIQFQKWEDSLMEWKRNNANHRDQSQYNDFVEKMEGCRRQLLQRRETLRQKRLDTIREAQAKKNNNQPKNDEMTNETSPSNITCDEPIVKLTDRKSVASDLFSSQRNNNEMGIPGLDLVSEKNVEPICNVTQPDPNIVAHVNNILGNPEIQSLLSNIQKQKHESVPVQSNDTNDLNVNNTQMYGSNLPTSQLDDGNRFGSYQREKCQVNPFRPNNQDSVNLSEQNVNQFEGNPKRGRYWNDNQQTDRFDRDRSNYTMQVNYYFFSMNEIFFIWSFIYL